MSTPKERQHIVGFVCGTLAAGQHLTHSSMSQHNPQGSLLCGIIVCGFSLTQSYADTLCIHSVVVAPSFRRQKVGTKMLQEYMEAIALNCTEVHQMRLLCKANLKSFYASCGFVEVGESDVKHGQDKWYEMRHVICHSSHQLQ